MNFSIFCTIAEVASPKKASISSADNVAYWLLKNVPFIFLSSLKKSTVSPKDHFNQVSSCNSAVILFFIVDFLSWNIFTGSL